MNLLGTKKISQRPSAAKYPSQMVSFTATKFSVLTTHHMIFDVAKTLSIHALTPTLWSFHMRMTTPILIGMPRLSAFFMPSFNIPANLIPLRWTFCGCGGMAATFHITLVGNRSIFLALDLWTVTTNFHSVFWTLYTSSEAAISSRHFTMVAQMTSYHHRSPV